MDVNKAILINDQYNNTLVAIENLQEHLLNADIEADELYGRLDNDLDAMAGVILHKKHKLIKEIEL